MPKKVLDKVDKTRPGDYIYFPLPSLLTLSFSHFEPFITAKGIFSFQRDPGSLCITTFPLNSGKGLTTWASCSQYHEKLWGMQG